MRTAGSLLQPTLVLGHNGRSGVPIERVVLRCLRLQNSPVLLQFGQSCRYVLITEPPWTPQQLHQVRDETDPQGRRRGPQVAHDTLTRWLEGCDPVSCFRHIARGDYDPLHPPASSAPFGATWLSSKNLRGLVTQGPLCSDRGFRGPLGLRPGTPRKTPYVIRAGGGAAETAQELCVKGLLKAGRCVTPM